jgi:hypothetical protein
MVEQGKKLEKAASSMGESVSDICTYVAPEELLSDYGGSLDWEWNFDSYWKDICDLHSTNQ